MCVNESRSALLSRSAFMGAVGAAALPLLSFPQTASAAVPAAFTVPQGLSAANARAAALAAASPRVRQLYGRVETLAASIGDATLRADVTALLQTATPRYQQHYATPEQQAALRDALALEGFVKADEPLQGIFPLAPGERALPFWAAPGSETGGHHSYPGGLCMHELFNASMGEQFCQTYDRLYFGGHGSVDRDTAVAAALYHDIMKVVVFQYHDDGTFFKEASIGGTGAHHVLSGAEAIVRGRDARFVVTLLSAHAAPSLGDEAKVVAWCRAAALIAGVDPVAYGLVRKTTDGWALAQRPPIEAFVNHLSDHDFVLSIPASTAVEAQLRVVAPHYGVAATGGAFEWWRLGLLSKMSSIALYQALTRGDESFNAALRSTV